MMSLRRFCILALAVGLSVGCYTLQPTGGSVPPSGTDIALDINDAGRVALGGSMGPEIALVEGRLLDADTSEYQVAVSALRLLRGGEQAWSGETVRIKRDYVSSIHERRLSRSRTAALAAVGVGGLAFLVTRSIIGGGSESPPKVPTDTAASQRSPLPTP